jgi:hypothetical protein
MDARTPDIQAWMYAIILIPNVKYVGMLLFRGLLRYLSTLSQPEHAALATRPIQAPNSIQSRSQD